MTSLPLAVDHGRRIEALDVSVPVNRLCLWLSWRSSTTSLVWLVQLVEKAVVSDMRYCSRINTLELLCAVILRNSSARYFWAIVYLSLRVFNIHPGE